MILQDPGIVVIPHAEYLEFERDGTRRIVAYRHLRALYLYEGVDVSLSDLVRMAVRVPLYLIDRRGYVVAQVRPVEGDDADA